MTATYPLARPSAFAANATNPLATLDSDLVNLTDTLNSLGNGASMLSTVAITTATITNANLTTALITTANVVTMSSSNVVITGGTAVLSTSNVTTLGAATINFGDGTQQTTASTVSAATIQPGFVNRIRNASLSAQQYGTSGAIDPGAPKFTADGFVVGTSGANVTWQIFTAANSGTSSPSYALRITGSNGVTDTFVRFPLAAEDSTILSKKIVTFQIGINASATLTTTPTLTIKHPSAVDNWANVIVDVNAVNLQTITSGGGSGITLAYAFTANASVTNGMEAIVDFGGALGNASTFIQIFAPDMRVTPGVVGGLVASPQPAEIRNATSDIAWCQRFLASSYPNGTSPGAAIANGVGGSFVAPSSTGSPVFVPFPVPMRSAPASISYWDLNGNANKTSLLAVGTITPFTHNEAIGAGPGAITANGFMFAGGAFAGALFLNYTADVTIIGG